MALLSDDGDFYFRAAITWLLSANIAVAILWGWIRGFRSKMFYLIVLVYSMRLLHDGLKLRTFLANIPESRRFKCPGSVGEWVLIEGAYIQDFLRAANNSFLVAVVAVLIVWEKRGRPRPPAGGLGGLVTIFIEILICTLSVLTCVHSLPVLILDYMTATANRGDAAVA